VPLSDTSAGLLRALIYPVQFERDPVDGIERVLEMVIGARALGASPAEYRAAVREALESDAPLAELIPQPHSEVVIRGYLAEVARRLEVVTP
jgi:hypothetical protein